MKIAAITPLILTYNESTNLAATLDALSWAERVVVVDSGSTDATQAIARRYANVEVVERAFDDHTRQWNFGLQQVETEWVLTLDADYICPGELPGELAKLPESADVYFAKFRYCVFGRPLRSSLYPPRAVLFRPAQVQYVADGHTQLLAVEGRSTGFLNTVLLHDDRKSLMHWCHSQVKYAALEAEKLASTPADRLGWKDRLRKRIFIAPLLTVFYCLFARGLILDGWSGWYYTLQRVFAELLLSLTLLDKKLRNKRRVASSE